MWRGRMEAMVKTWVGQSLHERFDRIVEEPVPETLICLLIGRDEDGQEAEAMQGMTMRRILSGPRDADQMRMQCRELT